MTSELALQLVVYQGDKLFAGDEWVTSALKLITAAIPRITITYGATVDELQSYVKILFFI